MNRHLIKNIVAWLASLRSSEGVDLPDLPSSGRSSVEPLSNRIIGSLETFGSVSPLIDFRMLACLKQLWLFNPDLSQYVTNIVNLGNTGHQITVDAMNDQRAEAALSRINEAASRIYINVSST